MTWKNLSKLSSPGTQRCQPLPCTHIWCLSLASKLGHSITPTTIQNLDVIIFKLSCHTVRRVNPVELSCKGCSPLKNKRVFFPSRKSLTYIQIQKKKTSRVLHCILDKIQRKTKNKYKQTSEKTSEKTSESHGKSWKIIENHEKSSKISDFTMFFCTKVVATPPLEAFDAELVCRHEEVHGLGWWF